MPRENRCVENRGVEKRCVENRGVENRCVEKSRAGAVFGKLEGDSGCCARCK